MGRKIILTLSKIIQTFEENITLFIRVYKQHVQHISNGFRLRMHV